MVIEPSPNMVRAAIHTKRDLAGTKKSKWTRDYFMAYCKPGQKDYYQRISANVVAGQSEQMQWQTVCGLLDVIQKKKLEVDHIAGVVR